MGCDANYSWGHPVARGGWDSHKADLSDKDLLSAIAMAKATFKALCNYRVEILELAPCDRTLTDRPDRELDRRITGPRVSRSLQPVEA